MQSTILGKFDKNYIIQVSIWCKGLGADEITIWSDGSVTAWCKDGSICDRYKPTTKELAKANKHKISWREEAAFYGEYL